MMTILILGATGFVGSKVTQLLLKEGHRVVCASRDVATTQAKFPQAEVIYCDFLHDMHSKVWLSRLAGIDVIINCVGIFYHRDQQLIWDVHLHTPQALYKAAEQTQVKYIIHLSALNIEHYHNNYAQSKLAIENVLRHTSIPSVILKPSFIYGHGAGGGMSLLQLLAAMPIITPLPDQGQQEFQPIHVNDLAEAIKNLVEQPLEGAQSLTAVSSERVTLKNMLLAMRQWLGFKKTRFISIPLFLIKLTAKFGDYVPYSTVNTPAIHMLELGNTTNAAQAKKFQDLARVTPMNFSTGLQQHPASTADRWYAKLSLLRPLLRFSLVFMWLMSALTSLLPYTQAESYSLLQQVGIPLVAIGPSLYAAILLNAIIGIGLLFNYQTKINYILQAAVIIFYMLVISIKLPYLWLEPFGPIVKNIPILMSILVLYTMES